MTGRPPRSPLFPYTTLSRSAPPQNAPLGSAKRKSQPPVALAAADSGPAGSYLPQSGQTFLQVAAGGRNEADGIADVLNKKGDRKSTRLNSSHLVNRNAAFCL